MQREYYLNLAAQPLRMPIGAHLLLHEQPDPDKIPTDGRRLGAVIVQTARRFRTPLAIPLMDLMLEKTALLEILGVPAQQIERYHFTEPPGAAAMERVAASLADYDNARMRATAEAIAHVAGHDDLLPVGMVIGPFSLMVRLVPDPITAVHLAGRGQTAAQNPKLALVEAALELGTRVIEWSLHRQIAAGARAVVICEPAASTAYISPRQMAAGSDIFDRFVMQYNRRLKRRLAEAGVDLIFHCCGEVTDQIVQRFVQLDPAILSLGSGRKLWELAPLVPKTTVLFGNLPSRKFFSDAEMTVDEVARLARELIQRMRDAGHPFILGSECDVLSVPGAHETILRKVDAFMDAVC